MKGFKIGDRVGYFVFGLQINTGIITEINDKGALVKFDGIRASDNSPQPCNFADLIKE